MPKPNDPSPTEPPRADDAPRAPNTQRIAKLLARAGVASRREIERMIAEGRVALNDKVLDTPATLLTSLHGVTVDGVTVKPPAPARLFLFHKPPGLLTAANDPAGRRTIYDALPEELPRVMPVGRLDFNTEGLLLLTTDGELKRQLELPASGVERTYRARAYGEISQAQLEDLIDGIEIDGMRYGAIDANLERRTGANVWVEMTLTEGKNREVRRVLEHFGLEVSRLIRTRYGPFVLADLPPGEVVEVRQHDLITFRKSLDLPPAKRSPLRFETKVPAPVPAAPAPKATPAERRPAVEPDGRRRLPRPTPVKTDAPRRTSDERAPGARDSRHRDERPASGRPPREERREGRQNAAPRERDAPRPFSLRTSPDAARRSPRDGEPRFGRIVPRDDTRGEERPRASFGDRARAAQRDRQNRAPDERFVRSERRGDVPASGDRARPPRQHPERPRPGKLSLGERPRTRDERPKVDRARADRAGPPRGASERDERRPPRPQAGRDRPTSTSRAPRNPGPKRPPGGGRK